MPETIEHLKSQLSQLTELDRWELANFLWESLGSPDDKYESEEAFVTELNRRAAELENGTVVGEPVDEVMKELREKYSCKPS